MFESLKEAFKTFSHTTDTKTYSFASVLKGNILSSPGTFGSNGVRMSGSKSNSPASNMVSNKFLSTYYNKMREIQDYEVNDLTQTIITIYSDYLIGYINKDTELVSLSDKVPNAEVAGRRLNKIFKDLDVINEVKNHFWDIIYDGTWCFKVSYDKESRKYVKYYLQNPHSVVTILTDNNIKSHLVVSRDGIIYEVKPYSIFRIGKTELTLLNDINKNFYQNKKKEDTLIRDEMMVACMPLYFNITGKVKEYLLKEQILSLLSIKDLVQPLLLLIRLDKNTAIDEGNKLALNVENMINKYSDISSIISSNFGINSLIDSLMNNIRVIPDYQGGIGDMNNVDLSKVTNKISEIETSLENKKDVIMSALSIPRALYSGEATKWDAIKASQRLLSKINSYVTGISDSLKLEAIKFYKDIYRMDLDPELVTINLFKKTDVDYSRAISNGEIATQLVQGIQNILQGAQQAAGEMKIIDVESYLKYVRDQIKLIDPTIESFFNDGTIQNAMKILEQSQNQQQ